MKKKSISTVVQKLADKILNKIIGNISINNKCHISQYNEIQFYEGVVKELLSEESDDRTQIKVIYTIHNIKNKAELSRVEKIGMDCNANDETNEITIISYIENGNFQEDLKPSLYHELTHLYQYHMGMHKNINRYELAIQKYQEGTGMEQILALTIYYSFPHEQDAFAHQFYATLMHSKPFTDAEVCIKEFIHYRVFVNNFNGVLQHQNSLKDEIKEYGFSIESYKNYIGKQIRRFHNKLKHAYDKYDYDKGLVINEFNHHRMIRNILLLEQMKHTNNGIDCDLCIESFYKPFQWDIKTKEVAQYNKSSFLESNKIIV